MKMRAAIVEQYGAPSVVRLAEVPPPEPKPGEVLVRVRAAAVTIADARIRGSRFPAGFGLMSRLIFGVTRPRLKVLGSAFSGVVEGLGAGVDGLRLGDEVCGMAGMAMGAHAEYVAVAEKKVVRKPAAVSHDDAAGILFGGTTALHFLRDSITLRPGASVLVNGASGAVGTCAVQLAKHYGASVTAVTSGPNAELVASLGAERVVDYAVTPLPTLKERFDVVLDTVGTISPAFGKQLLAPNGTLLLVAGDLWALLQARGNVKGGVASERPADFAYLLQLMSEGHLSSVTDSVYSLEEIVRAYERVDSGRKRGSVIVRP
jgi:NADPH:quinone reductase-like Zn-dependent oxidoreductase